MPPKTHSLTRGNKLVQLEEKGMFLFEQTWIPSPWILTCENKTRTQIFVIQVAALGTNLISLPGTPWFYQEQDKVPSQVGCLAERTQVGAAEALLSPGGLWQPPRRALMDEDPLDPEHSKAMKQQELGAEDLGIYTQTL